MQPSNSTLIMHHSQHFTMQKYKKELYYLIYREKTFYEILGFAKIAEYSSRVRYVFFDFLGFLYIL